jgi:hypothetical protein
MRSVVVRPVCFTYTIIRVTAIMRMGLAGCVKTTG